MNCRIEYGIDTFSYYCTLTPKQKRKILEQLVRRSGFHTERNDYEENTYIYLSDCFAMQGIKIWVSRIKGSPWGLLIVVHPTLVLGEKERSKLYQPKAKKEYKNIVKQVDTLLEEVNVPHSVDDMKLYRTDVTANLILKMFAIVDEYIRIMKKGCLLSHYRLDKFRENEHKAKDCQTANQHSYKQLCKSAAFFAYDKTAQLEMIDAFPDTLIGKRVLRIEAQLRRKSIKKWVGKDVIQKSNWNIIKKLWENTEKILGWYLKRIQPVSGDYLRYRDATKITSQVKGQKIRERMLYLLRKTSDSDSLSIAIKKMKEKFRLSSGQCHTVLKRFQKLGISPITLVNSSDFERLPKIDIL